MVVVLDQVTIRSELKLLFFSSSFRRLSQQSDKPASLDFPFAPPLITITTNIDDTTTTDQSDAEANSSAMAAKKQRACSASGSERLGLGVPGTGGGMCYLSPFSIVTRGDRAPSESNLSSSGYSSMASPGPSRCGSNNPLFPSEMDDTGAG